MLSICCQKCFQFLVKHAFNFQVTEAFNFESKILSICNQKFSQIVMLNSIHFLFLSFLGEFCNIESNTRNICLQLCSILVYNCCETIITYCIVYNFVILMIHIQLQIEIKPCNDVESLLHDHLRTLLYYIYTITQIEYPWQ